MTKTVPLKKPHEFRRLYSKGKNAAGPYFVIYARRTGKNANRLGITVSKKLGGAVVRNRVRRRIRETFRLCEPYMQIGFDIVVVARRDAQNAEFQRLRSELLRVFNKLGIITSDNARAGKNIGI